MEVFFAWEKLRIVFTVFYLIALSVAPAFLFFGGDQFTVGRVLLVLVSANLLICIGPAGENYLCWFGLRRGVARIIIYAILNVLLLIWFWIMSVS